MDWTEKKNGQSGGTVVALESDRQGSLGLDRAVWVQTWRSAGVCAFRHDGQWECVPGSVRRLQEATSAVPNTKAGRK